MNALPAILIVASMVAAGVATPYIFQALTRKRRIRKSNERYFRCLGPLHDKIRDGREVTAAEVRPYAENLLTREPLYHALVEYGKPELFPQEYYSIVKGAESNLAIWLAFPTELGACPDEIEHIKRVTFTLDGPGHYEVFKYRVNAPHWAAENGWMLGVAGPYFDDSKPYDPVAGTFSRTDSTIDKVTPEDEAKWVHENIAIRRR